MGITINDLRRLAAEIGETTTGKYIYIYLIYLINILNIFIKYVYI